jgi:hypothetical protein
MTGLPATLEAALDATSSRLATHVLLEPDRVFEREVLGRSGGLSGARSAFFDGEYADASELLSGWLRTFVEDPWVLALHEDLAVRAVDALLTLVRAEVELEHNDAAELALQQTVRLFPTAVLAETQYPTWLRERFETARSALEGAATLHAPASCTGTVHGLPAPTGPIGVGRDGAWARWDCGGRKSRLYRVDPGTTLTYPAAFDTALRLDDGRPSLAVAIGDPAAIGEALAQSATLLGASAAEGWTTLGDERLLLVHVELSEGVARVSAARGSGDEGALRACVVDGQCGRELERWTLEAGWPQRTSPSRVAGVAALTTAGIATGTGIALEIVLRDALRRVDRCADSPACLVDAGAMDNRRDRARSLRTGATVAWIAAGATVTAGVVALLPAWEGRAATVGVSAGPEGALLTVRIRSPRVLRGVGLPSYGRSSP